jgi:hypothetical protein
MNCSNSELQFGQSTIACLSPQGSARDGPSRSITRHLFGIPTHSTFAKKPHLSQQTALAIFPPNPFTIPNRGDELVYGRLEALSVIAE